MIFKKFDDIEQWLQLHEILNYEIIENEQYGYVVNVYATVYLKEKNLSHIPVKFNVVTGDFYCQKNKLKSLDFAPFSVNGFYCQDNQLTSLIGGPTHVKDTYCCSYNCLRSLEGCPDEVGYDFICSGNQLASLQYCPKNLKGGLYCDHNSLTSLEHCPDYIEKFFNFSFNQIISLAFCPDHVGGACISENNLALNEYWLTFDEFYQKHIEFLIIRDKNDLMNLLPESFDTIDKKIKI